MGRRALVVTLGIGVALAWSSGGNAAASNSCVAATTTLVRAFARDYSAGRVAAIEPMWAPASRFQWFSSRAPGARLGARAYNRATLGAYFRVRVRAHERLRITRLAAGYDSARGIVNFNGKLVRSADDLPADAPQDFKGAAECAAGRPTLIVWSM